jgi:hypothetical protein
LPSTSDKDFQGAPGGWIIEAVRKQSVTSFGGDQSPPLHTDGVVIRNLLQDQAVLFGTQSDPRDPVLQRFTRCRFLGAALLPLGCLTVSRIIAVCDPLVKRCSPLLSLVDLTACSPRDYLQIVQYVEQFPDHTLSGDVVVQVVEWLTEIGQETAHDFIGVRSKDCQLRSIRECSHSSAARPDCRRSRCGTSGIRRCHVCAQPEFPPT